MKLLFVLIGAVLGLAGGGLPGAAGGAILGFVAAIVWQSRRPVRVDAADAVAPPPAEDDAAAGATLVQRVQALEDELAELRTQVRGLAARAAAGATVDPVAAARTRAAIDPAATPARASASAPLPLPIAPQPLPRPVVEPAAPLAVATANPADAPVDRTPAPGWTAPAPRAPVRPPPAAPPVPLRDRLPPVVARLLFGGNTIVKIGVLLLFIGLAFLLRYTAERVTVPVELRYAGVALVGAVMLGLGWRLRARTDRAGGSGYGVILQGAGIGVFYLTALAALRLHPLLSPALAFAFMAAVALLAAVLAVLQDAPWLALVAVAEGFAAPVLVSTGSGAYLPLFSYMAILDVGILAMAWFKAWRPLNLVGAVATFALAGAWAQSHYAPADRAGVQAFLVLFFLLFTATGVLFARRALAQGDAIDAQRPLAERAADTLRRVGRVDSTLTFGVPLAAFALQYLLVRDLPWGPAWAAAAFALFHILLGGALMRGAGARYALLGEAHVVVGTIFATLAIPLALEGVWTGATWAIEAAGMYWLGARQRRPYARAFALLVLAGAATRLLAGLGLDLHPATPLLTGSTLGMAMLALALVAMDAVRRRIAPAERGTVERIAVLVLPLAANAALAALAWMLLPTSWAAAVTAWLAFGAAALQARLAAPVLRASSVLLHLVALTGLTLSLQPEGRSATLAADWPGLVAAALIGAALLATGWLGLRDAWRTATADAPPVWSLGSGAGLVAGFAVVAASLLSVMPAEHAALAWPWIGVLAMGLGARLRHPALALSAFALQLAAAIATILFGPSLWPVEGAPPTLPWGPLVLALAGVVVGDLARGAARRAPAWWCAAAAQWTLVAWAALWWSQVLPPALWQQLQARGTLAAWPQWCAIWVTLTSATLLVVAAWRDWRVLGQATLATLPLWAWIALAGPIGADGAAPSAALGWLAWPLALAWHVALLKWQARWRPAALEAPLHVAGLWFFVALAARECLLRFAALGAPGSAWAALGEMLVPALVLVLLAQPALRRRWPLSVRPDAWLLAGGAPIALALFAWLWIVNTTAGAAAPLAYVPLLNPLEIGQGLALFALLAWVRALPPRIRESIPRPALFAVLGATAFALVTGLVLRACHHLAGVAWDADALFASTLAQAALSVTWSLIGVALMLAGHRATRRAAWLVGAALLGVVVAKLFLVELADRGSLYRIVSFLVVGALMLVVGYFAPLPPKRDDGAAAPRAEPEAT